ncbi:MAG: hypothetical protein JWN30_179 [Bacilli bacterium]|nr:hypothetical protein [Bacilli bacterium]
MINSRYYCYLIFLTMLSNVMVLVPNILLQHRFDGALTSSLLAVPISMAFIYLFTKSIARFPSLTLPEILVKSFPNWFRFVVTLPLIIIWFWAGSLPLLAFTTITKGFLNPEMSEYLILGIYLFFVSYVACMDHKKVMYTVEAILFFVAPIILFILCRSIFEKNFSWESVNDIITHIENRPDYDSLSAATYIFTGYVNMIIFNKSVKSRLNVWYWILIPLVGTAILLTSFLIPVGLLGRYAVTDFVFPWVTATDTLRLEYFFLERVMLVFIMLYLFLVLLHSAVVWHVGVGLFKSLWKNKQKTKRYDFGIIILFCMGVLVMRKYLSDVYMGQALSAWFIRIRFVVEAVLVGTLLLAARRQTKA